MSNSTTHCIYRIVCFPTGRVYVGQAIDHKTRKSAHFSSLKSCTHHNRKLQRAYNKYGKSAFYFELLETDIPNELVNERECYWIGVFDSQNNGFNITSGGMDFTPRSPQKPCAWNGLQYPSMAACSRAIGITAKALEHRLKMGWSRDTDVPANGASSKRRCTWNGIEYASVSECATANGVHVATMYERLVAGHKCNSDLKSHNAKK